MTESTDTMTNLQPVPIKDHNLSVFDELSHQYNAVQNSSLTTIEINNFHSSYLMPTTMNDYERRFQRSLQKLTIPSWYIDTNSSTNISTTTSKQSLLSTSSIVPWKSQTKERQRTPEIIHIRRPHSYRSCRSSLAASRSPSIHSCHPNYVTDGMNLTLLVPSTSSTRKNHKYQKGIERVSKSSHWYQPTHFASDKSTKDKAGIKKTSTSVKSNHYDIPKIHHDDKNLIPQSSSNTEKSLLNEQNNNMITNDKQQDNCIKSNESQIMPLANITKESFSQIELIEKIDEENDKYLLSDKQMDEDLLERTANDLVQSILADILLRKNLDDIEDKNSGVRELSEDENGLRELDENDMNNTDEFIVFATQPDTSDDEQISTIPKNNPNRLYTFSKINDNLQTNLNQNSSKSILEQNQLTTITNNTSIEKPFEKIFYTSPIYHSEKQTCYSNSHLSSSEGVNEETARIGRLLLDSIPLSFIEHIQNLSPNRNNAQFIPSEEDDYYKSPILEEYNQNTVHNDSAYSSNQERINIQQTIYETLSECYSGYSFIQSDFLTPNLSSIQTTTTTDEAYESEPTTMSSSIATTTHIHPDLEHEFDYPSPPPPVPDRRLKPDYLKTPPTVKPRLNKQENTDSLNYSIIQKTKQLSIKTIQQYPDSNSIRTMSCRHYCGTIPISNEITQSVIKIDENVKDKRNNRTFNCLHPTTTDENKKSSLSLNKTKIKKQKLVTEFDEATNGLAIRLPAPICNKPNLHKTSTPLSKKRTNLMTKNRPSFYETSV